MSHKSVITELTSGGSDRFLAVVERLEREARPADQVAFEVKTSLRASGETLRFEALIESLRGRLDLPRPAAVSQALRNAELRTAFISEIGGLTAAEVAELAGSRARNSSALAGRWRAERRIFAVPWGGELLYPAFQFADGAPRPVIGRVLEAFGERPSGWEVALWFATPSSYLPRDGRPIERLADPDALVAAARAELSLPEF